MNLAHRLTSRSGTAQLLLATLVLVVAALLGRASCGPVGAQDFQARLFLPLAVSQFPGPASPTAGPSPGTGEPTMASPTAQAGSRTATPTPSPTATRGPTPTPTLSGAQVAHPTSPNAIILQIGYTQTDQIGEAWEEMNGTPWFTLYGDGRLIAGHQLFDIDQPLYVATVDEYFVQLWLRKLTYDIQYFSLRDSYSHPRNTKPSVHYYVETNGGSRRVRLAGFRDWESRDAPEEPDRIRVKALALFTRELELFVSERLSQRYSPEMYTILSQEIAPIFPDVPTWEGPAPARAIAIAAPTAASNYINKRVGHKFVDGDAGRQVQEYVRPFRDQLFPFYTIVCEFDAGGGQWHYTVGARQEVPGGSPFLPDVERAEFYRRDAGSGTPPLASDLDRLGLLGFLDLAWPDGLSPPVATPVAMLPPHR